MCERYRTLSHGALLREGGDWINAETCLLRLLELDTGPAPRRRATARQHLALLCRSLGRQREAAAHVRALSAEDPELARRVEDALREADAAAVAAGNGRDSHGNNLMRSQ